MARLVSLSGFPEWLPDAQAVETHLLECITDTFELYGYAGIHTRSVEPISALMSKGETSKEVYRLSRLAQQAQGGSEDDLGLHFDLTVPLARYVLENAGHLNFPFKRYQVQKVWRGERPQDGRFREFTQADIDVVAPDELPSHYEVEVPIVMAAAFDRLRTFGLPPIQISVNNRRVAQGFYEGLGLSDIDGTLRVIDKLDKIGPDALMQALMHEVGATQDQARSCLELAQISGTDSSVADSVLALGVRNDLLDQGLEELVRLLEAAHRQVPGVIGADLKIARGLDYYTGSVYETTLRGHPELGSICSGGRYDSLVADGPHTYPGVGMSIGVTRLMSRLLRDGIVTASRRVPTAVLVAVVEESTRYRSDAVATALRARGIPTEVAPSAAKFGKQIRHADRRGIPYVWFPAADDDGEVKDIRSGEQGPADASTWMPPAADLTIQVQPGEHQG
ncbi:MAG: histidine--tRNA ligase [Beutenbergiaceae bacterium]